MTKITNMSSVKEMTAIALFITTGNTVIESQKQFIIGKATYVCKSNNYLMVIKDKMF